MKKFLESCLAKLNDIEACERVDPSHESGEAAELIVAELKERLIDAGYIDLVKHCQKMVTPSRERYPSRVKLVDVKHLIERVRTAIVSDSPRSSVKQWLTVKEAAPMLGTTQANLKRWCQQGAIDCRDDSSDSSNRRAYKISIETIKGFKPPIKKPNRRAKRNAGDRY